VEGFALLPGTMSPPETSAAAPARRLLPRQVLFVLAALATLHPAVSAGTALGVGMALALTVGNPLAAQTRREAKRLLALSVVGLGAGMNLLGVLRAGAHGLLYTVASLSLCFGAGLLLRRALGVERVTGLLITVGTAICGGSAIAAAVPVLGAKDDQTSVALGTVFLLNAVALFLFPPIGHLLLLGQDAFGIWAALAIHDTSSVVGAAMRYGARALAVGPAVKLARALWIVPVTLGLGWLERRRQGAGAVGRARFPLFILGFLLMATLDTFGPALVPAGRWVCQGAQRLLVLTLFLIGANLSRPALEAVGLRPLLLGVLLWVGIGTATLSGVATGLIR
jgi:uncharacterized integral membrane protein (TIGR00698 family)